MSKEIDLGVSVLEDRIKFNSKMIFSLSGQLDTLDGESHDSLTQFMDRLRDESKDLARVISILRHPSHRLI